MQVGYNDPDLCLLSEGAQNTEINVEAGEKALAIKKKTSISPKRSLSTLTKAYFYHLADT